VADVEILNGDIELHVDVDGDAASPPILLLHGITSSTRTWTWLVPALTDRYRVLRLDFRGHGRSGRFAGGYDFAGYVSDAAAACTQVAGEPAIVVGHSLGGGTAAALAQRHPELVRAVVLEDPALGASRDVEGNALMDGFRMLRDTVPRVQADAVAPGVLAGVLAVSPAITAPTLGALVHQDAIDAMAASLLELDASVLDPVLGRAMTHAYDPHATIPVPTLVLAADPSSPDCVARSSDLDAMRQASPHAEIEVVRGAGHLIHDELAHRDDFVRSLLAFLARLDAAG
jgi:pimeloyl-ACP methyl ester carboxylesterase